MPTCKGAGQSQPVCPEGAGCDFPSPSPLLEENATRIRAVRLGQTVLISSHSLMLTV